MLYENELLKMKILMYFQQNDLSLCTVGKMAERLGTFKQKISKLLIQMEEEGFVNRSNNRHPELTESGIRAAEEYANKIKITLEYLLNEGVSLESAEKDAYSIVLLSSKSTMDAIKRKYLKAKIKKELASLDSIGAGDICKRLKDGMYPINFLIYRQHPDYDRHLSMANKGFEHPAYLFVENGIGKIKLKIKDMKARTPYKDGMVKAQASEVSYLYDDQYMKAEFLGSFISFPLDVIKFTIIGENERAMLHGSLFIKIKSTINTTYMPESEAIFTIII